MYVPCFFKKGDTFQGGTLFKGGHYLRKYDMSMTLLLRPFTWSILEKIYNQLCFAYQNQKF